MVQFASSCSSPFLVLEYLFLQVYMAVFMCNKGISTHEAREGEGV